MKKQFVNWLVYRWRYILGYGSLVLLYIIAVVVASLHTPGGLTSAEIASLAVTNDLAAGNLAIVNLPWHLLQYASLSLFGVSIISIKLPSIVLSLASTIAIYFLLRRWFKPNITILSMLIMVTAGQIIFIAQLATPNILYLLYSALILLFTSLILQSKTKNLLWKISLAISIALSLYTPFFLLINLGLLTVALIHPYPRLHIFKKAERNNWLIAGSLIVVLVLPLVYLISQSPTLIGELVGYQMLQANNYIDNLKVLLYSYFWVEPLVINGKITPILDFSSLALIGLGVIVLYSQRFKARTYMIIAWMILTLPVLLIDPSLTAILIVPLFILLAIGTETLLSEWYKLFPLNPYARTVGLILTTCLVGVMIISSFDRFINGYRYMPAAANQFSTDLNLVKSQLKLRPAKTLLITSQSELPLYQSLSLFSRDQLIVSDSIQPDIGNVLVTNQSTIDIPDNWQLITIATNERQSDANRLYLYKAPKDEVQ